MSLEVAVQPIAQARPSPVSLVFRHAEQPELLRTSQKDEQFCHMLEAQISELSSRTMGARFSTIHQKELHVLANMFYFGLTSGCNFPTLGEEYCDLTPVTSDSFIPPSLRRRLTLIMMHVLAPYGARALHMRLSRLASQPGGQSWKRMYSKLTPRLPQIIDVFSKLHTAAFYLGGVYHHVSKRLARVRYVTTHIPPDETAPFELLGIFMLAQLAITAVIKLRQSTGPQPRSNSDASTSPVRGMSYAARMDVEDAPKCTLCLSTREQPTTASCGHIFCWECITEWCTKKAECPLCRQPMTLSSLLTLTAYP